MLSSVNSWNMYMFIHGLEGYMYVLQWLNGSCKKKKIKTSDIFTIGLNLAHK